MSYFQNPFDQDFQQSWPLGDRQFSPTFKCPRNKNNNDLMVCWNSEPYNLVGVTDLKLHYVGS